MLWLFATGIFVMTVHILNIFYRLVGVFNLQNSEEIFHLFRRIIGRLFKQRYYKKCV